MTEIARDKVRQHVGAATAAAAGSPSPKHRKDPAVCPTDEEALTPNSKTRSLDYVWKSGVAGGVAGCAVSLISRHRADGFLGRDKMWRQMMIMMLMQLRLRSPGQNHRRAARSSQDTISSQQSSFCQVYGIIIWCCHGHA